MLHRHRGDHRRHRTAAAGHGGDQEILGHWKRLLGQNVIAASPLAILAYAGPHIVHAVATSSRAAVPATSGCSAAGVPAMWSRRWS